MKILGQEDFDIDKILLADGWHEIESIEVFNNYIWCLENMPIGHGSTLVALTFPIDSLIAIRGEYKT